MDPIIDSTITKGMSGTRMPDINCFGTGSIKAVAPEPLEVTQEELNAIIGNELFYKAAAIVAMRHGLLKIKGASV